MKRAKIAIATALGLVGNATIAVSAASTWSGTEIAWGVRKPERKVVSLIEGVGRRARMKQVE